MALPKIAYPSPRVSQFDAQILDNELFSLLKLQLSDTFKLLSNKSWSYDLHPELWSLILKLTMFKLTTLKSGSSYGFGLQNLKLSDSKTGKLIGSGTRYLLLATIIGDCLFKKLQSYLFSLEESSGGSRSKLERLKALISRHKTTFLRMSEDTVRVLELLNFVLFLIYGKYPSLVYRALGITVTPVVADLLKFNGNNVNFEFQNRQLVWNVMTEFLVFILPLLQLRKWRRALRSLLPKSSDTASIGYSEKPVLTKFTSLSLSQCAICVEIIQVSGILAAPSQITNPCITNCGHIFCYVCLATRLNAIESGNEKAEGCPRCRMQITSFTQYGNEADQVDPDAIMVEYETASDSEETEDDSPEVRGTPAENEKNYSASAELRSDLEEDGIDFSENEDLEEDDEFESMEEFDSGEEMMEEEML